MWSARPYVIRLSSKPCVTCQDLCRQKGRIEAALRNARNLYQAAVEAIDSTALRILEEELKQISAARRLTCYAIQTHRTSEHPQTHDVRAAA
jgi:hypothetical protein